MTEPDDEAFPHVGDELRPEHDSVNPALEDEPEPDEPAGRQVPRTPTMAAE